MSVLFEVKNLNFVIAGGLGQVGLKLAEYLEKNGSKIVIIDVYNQKNLKILKNKNLFLNSKNIKIFNIDISKKKIIQHRYFKKKNYSKIIHKNFEIY